MDRQKVDELIQKFGEGTATREEEQALLDWYHSFPNEEIAWPSSGKSEREEVYHSILKKLQPVYQRKPPAILTWYRVAALIAIIAGIAIVMYYHSSPPLITISNQTGKIRQVRLPDQSVVWLNATSNIKYGENFTRDRHIELDGEAFFEVSKDPQHPFSVTAKKLEILVTGTSFNINAYKNRESLTVTVLTGTVNVKINDTLVSSLKPASQLDYNTTEHSWYVSKSDTSVVVAWTKGQLLFRGEPLSDIAATLENWYGVRFIFSDENMKHCRYYVAFDQDITLEQLLLRMSAIADFTYELDRKTNNVILKGKGCPETVIKNDKR